MSENVFFHLRNSAVAVLFIISNSPCSGQDWKWVNPLPTGDACYSVSFVDSSNGWLIAGGTGITMHTSDGGTSWESQDSGVRDYFRTVFFIDHNHGWLGGVNTYGLIMRTTDGGKIWAKSPTPYLGAFHYVQFFDQNNGYVAAERNYVLRTTDGGLSWINSFVSLSQIGGMFFFSPSAGFVVARGLFRTTDSGLSWQQLSSFGLADLGDLYFTDSLNGWFASQFNGISRTTDGGVSWQPLTDRISLQSLSFPERGFGWAFGTAGIYASSDSGKTWNMQSNLPQITQGKMLSRTLGYACGGFGFVYRTTDGGKNWVEISHHVTTGDLHSVYVSSPNRVWAAGGDPVIGGIIIGSSDGGQTWTTQYSQSFARFQSMAFADSGTTAWACGVGGTAVHTTDGGISWNYYTMPVTVNLHKIFFRNSMHGWCGGDGVILHTTDGGASWLVYHDSAGYEYRGLYFVGDKNGWAVGGDQNSETGIILRTSDGGISWTNQFTGQVTVLQAVSFLDSLKGWAIGDTLLYTSDGGSSWIPYARPANQVFQCIQFVDQHNGWMVGDGGSIYFSSNAGFSWNALNTPTTGWLEDIAIATDGTGYIVGDVGVVLKAIGGIINGIKPPEGTGRPSSFILSQNYPNPFNPSTIIRYEIQKLSAHVTIIVFNILGQRVRTLVNGIQHRGIHEVLWDGRASGGTDLPSGLYLYRVNVDGEELTKSMGLLR
jgi:photosystem II stability/assembly factor-like uncharacterized protein